RSADGMTTAVPLDAVIREVVEVQVEDGLVDIAIQGLVRSRPSSGNEGLDPVMVGSKIDGSNRPINTAGRAIDPSPTDNNQRRERTFMASSSLKGGVGVEDVSPPTPTPL